MSDFGEAKTRWPSANSPTLLSLPNDILRYLIFTRHSLDSCSILVCRFVCKSMRAMIPAPRDPDSHLEREAARHGYLAVLRWWLPTSFGSWSIPELEDISFPIGIAARAGHIHILEWLMSRAPFLFFAGESPFQSISRHSNVCIQAAAGNQLAVLQWARGHSIDWDERVAEEAAGEGHLELLRWAIANGCPWDHGVYTRAASGGHLDVLKWIVSVDETGCLNGPSCDVCFEAAGGGHLELLRWAHERGAPCNESVCSVAAFRGHLHILQWLRSQGVPWDDGVCFNAAYAHRLDVLRWARENNAPWVAEECLDAASGGDDGETKEWIRGQIEDVNRPFSKNR